VAEDFVKLYKLETHLAWQGLSQSELPNHSPSRAWNK
jgi:hypothetical protein